MAWKSSSLTRPVRRARLRVLVACVGVVWLAGAPAMADSPSDAWITTKVRMKLLTAAGFDGLDVSVDTVDGHVTLEGDVASERAKEQAAAVARDTAGVKGVRDLLVVAPSAADDVEQRVVDDETLKRQVEAALARDAALANSDIRVVSVNEGRVLLAGRADSLSAHRRALEDARSVRGVTRVATEIDSPDELGDGEAARRPDVRRRADAAAQGA